MDNNEQLVHFRILDWKEIVLRSWGKDWNKPEPAYEFTARTFDDPKHGGPYNQA